MNKKSKMRLERLMMAASPFVCGWYTYSVLEDIANKESTLALCFHAYMIFLFASIFIVGYILKKQRENAEYVHVQELIEKNVELIKVSLDDQGKIELWEIYYRHWLKKMSEKSLIKWSDELLAVIKRKSKDTQDQAESSRPQPHK